MSQASHKHEVTDKGKYNKRASKQKWTETDYYIQEDDYVVRKYVIKKVSVIAILWFTHKTTCCQRVE